MSKAEDAFDVLLNSLKKASDLYCVGAQVVADIVEFHRLQFYDCLERQVHVGGFRNPLGKKHKLAHLKKNESVIV